GAGIEALLHGERPVFSWDEERTTLAVVVASEGYPDKTVTGAAIHEFDCSATQAEHGTHVYYAGVADSEDGDDLVASSGRVLL
ncbi:phosphoribosylglycinamide synthetase C domain-containing protein, partial [Bifidobacterium breve]